MDTVAIGSPTLTSSPLLHMGPLHFEQGVPEPRGLHALL